MVLLPYFRDPSPPLCVCIPAILFHSPAICFILFCGLSSLFPAYPPPPSLQALPTLPRTILIQGGADEREGLFYPTLYQVTLPGVSSCASPHLEIFPHLPVVISAFSFLPSLVNTSRLWQ